MIGSDAKVVGHRRVRVGEPVATPLVHLTQYEIEMAEIEKWATRRGIEMTEMVERVARAIFESDMKWAPVYEHEFEENKQLYLAAARAAIEAMREPTDGMVDEMGILRHAGEHTTAEIWAAGIDAALKGEGVGLDERA